MSNHGISHHNVYADTLYFALKKVRFSIIYFGCTCKAIKWTCHCYLTVTRHAGWDRSFVEFIIYAHKWFSLIPNESTYLKKTVIFTTNCYFQGTKGEHSLFISHLARRYTKLQYCLAGFTYPKTNTISHSVWHQLEHIACSALTCTVGGECSFLFNAWFRAEIEAIHGSKISVVTIYMGNKSELFDNSLI